MWGREIKIMLLWIILSSISCSSTLSQSLDKHDCGNSSSCYSKPPSCKSDHDCEYLLKYSVSGQDVVFELSTNKYQWIAVGFNSKKRMAGGKSLSCEIHENKSLLNHYNMPDEKRPKPSSNTNVIATLRGGGNIFYCRITRKLDLSEVNKTNLNNPVYLLYAAGEMEKTGDVIDYHKFMETSQNLLSVSEISDNTDNSKAKKRIDTSLCGKSFGCSRLPSGCHDNRDCDFLLTFKKNGTVVEFAVSGKADGWISVGFNTKPKMGGTDAVICQTRGGDVKLFVANLEYDSPTLQKPNETSLLDSKYEGGIIYCKFTRPLKSTADKRLSIDVSRYIIYAKGSGSTTLNEHKDGNNGCSNVKVDFGNYIFYELGDCDATLAKVHGSFMIFAWMFLAVISMFIARYSRSLWKGRRILGNDAWFQFHRLVMGLAVLMTIIAIIIIFVHTGGWSESAGDHAIFGIIVLVLAIIQPTIAFFRPHPHHGRRPLFNWFHRLVALFLIIMAAVAVSKGTRLLGDSGGDTSYKLLIALIVIVIVTALVLEFLALRHRTKQLTDLTSQNMQEERTEILEIKVQRVLLVAFSLIVFLLAVVMIAYVAGAGSDDDDDDDDD